MKPRLASTFSLLLLLVVSCAPQATQPAAVPPVAALPSATPVQPIEIQGEATQPPPVVEAPTLAPPPIATSRGPDLHATDPTTVSLASGQYQLVEFFRFT